MTKRRDFIKKSVLGTAGIAIGGLGFSSKSYASIIGANDRVNLAVIGIRGRGNSHIRSYCSLKDSHNVRLITLCDADEQFFAERSKTVFDTTGVKPTTEWDMRKVFDNPDIHAVSFATPNHWHALGTIWACQAGKHVYVEKPACHNVYEGQKMIEAASKYNVRVQVGSQNRSIINIMEAIKFLHEGGIGDVFMARGICYKPRDSFGIANDSEPPANLHYDIWLGPAPYRPYNEKRLHYNWHWFWDTGSGDTGNQGVNEIEILRWGLNKHELPVSIFSDGGVYGIDPKECAQETPNTHNCTFKYKDGKIIEFETRGRYTNGEAGFILSSDEHAYIGHMFYGTEGYMELAAGTGLWKAFRKRETVAFRGSDDQDISKQHASGEASHHANFIDAIRSGKNETLRCPITDGFYSSALPALANISYRLGRSLKYNDATNKFINDPEADAMLTRIYRKPYAVPDEV
jgi:predicted dehydrogenase